MKLWVWLVITGWWGSCIHEVCVVGVAYDHWQLHHLFDAGDSCDHLWVWLVLTDGRARVHCMVVYLPAHTTGMGGSYQVAGTTVVPHFVYMVQLL